MFGDFKYALRMLVKTPVFTVVAVLTLALGIGANSAIFSVIDAVMLRPLSFPRPQELIAVWSKVRNESERETGSYPDYADLRDQSRTVAAMFAYTRASTIIGTGDQSRQVEGLAVTSDIFRTLGIAPALGRGFTREEDNPAARVIVLTHEAWQRYCNAEPQIIGRQIMCSLRPYTVIGVMPPGFRFPLGGEFCEYLMPLHPLVPEAPQRRQSHFAHLVGRLAPGATVQQASAEMSAIAGRLEKDYPDFNARRSYYALPLHRDIVGEVRPALFTIIAAVIVVLLIACANVANLLLVRATQRRREIGIRTALGASRRRIIRQLVSEGLLLALLGAAGGLVLAWWGVDLLRLFGPQDVPRLNEVRMNGAMVVFTLVAAVFSTLLFALFPALQVSRPNVSESLQEGSRGAVGPESHRLRALLVIAQVALSMLLLTAAGLLIKSFGNLRAVNPGFEPSRVVTFGLALPRSKYMDAPDKQLDFFTRLNAKLRGLPGVEFAGAAAPLPFSGNDNTFSFWIMGRPDPGLGNHLLASHLTIFGDYFQAMHIPLLAGRSIDARDHKDATPVIMVNEAFVRRFFNGHSPLGEHITIDHPDKRKQGTREIIGVVGNSRHESLATEPGPEFYVPSTQEPDRYMDIVLRTGTETLSGLDTAVRRAVHEIDGDVYVPTLRPMENLIGTTLVQPRFNMMLLGCFAAAAMILAAIGIYGVIAYNVAQRTKEIGIRMALGAQRIDMLTMILRQSLTIVAIGLGLGLLSALGATHLMRALLFGVGANDVATYAAVVLLLGIAALLASYLPARRATLVDPVEALRTE
jgi:putative ABC transport system permease protein